ncbi:MAG: hypothetical protein ISR65_05785 [Bacteriovoracaceae bacterium]|nr:hypothetical protein [Bacteriovoracaceae bacterium]
MKIKIVKFVAITIILTQTMLSPNAHAMMGMMNMMSNMMGGMMPGMGQNQAQGPRQGGYRGQGPAYGRPVYGGRPNYPQRPQVQITRDREHKVTTTVAPKLTLSNKANWAKIVVSDKDDFAAETTVDVNISDLEADWNADWEDLTATFITTLIETNVKILSDYVYLKATPFTSGQQAYGQMESNYIRIKVLGLKNKYNRILGKPSVRLTRNKRIAVTTTSAPKLKLSNGATSVRLLVSDKDDFNPEIAVELDVFDIEENWDEDWALLLEDMVIVLIENDIDLRFNLVHIKVQSTIGEEDDEAPVFESQSLRVKIGGLKELYSNTLQELMGEAI